MNKHLFAFCVMALALTLSAAPARSQPLKPFTKGSMKKIVADHHGAPFVLTLWSLNCPYCREELTALSALAKKTPNLPVVLVATDSPADREAVLSVLHQYALDSLEVWLFADEFTERLRFEIDPAWYGELPRTYFFANGTRMRASSGPVPAREIASWLDARTHVP